MPKVLFFLILCFYAVYLVGGVLIKILTFGSPGSKNKIYKKDNVHVQKPPNGSKKSFEGGEYVDFEDVK